jgi:hypothetical protein
MREVPEKLIPPAPLADTDCGPLGVRKGCAVWRKVTPLARL